MNLIWCISNFCSIKTVFITLPWMNKLRTPYRTRLCLGLVYLGHLPAIQCEKRDANGKGSRHQSREKKIHLSPQEKLRFTKCACEAVECEANPLWILEIDQTHHTILQPKLSVFVCALLSMNFILMTLVFMQIDATNEQD